MKLGYQIHARGGDFQKVAEQVTAFENAGLDIVWSSETYSVDAITTIAYIAARTTRVQLGTCIVPIYGRTPALLAQTAAGLDWVSGGRAILGLGSSGPTGYRRLARPPLRSAIATDARDRRHLSQRLATRGSGAPRACVLGTAPGRPGYRARQAAEATHAPVRDRIPVYVAALGQKNVELTAEIADGWIPLLVMPERVKSVWSGALARGTARRAAELGPLETVAGGILAIGDDVLELRELERPRLGLYLGGMGARGANYYNDLACQYGFEREAKLVQDLYLDGQRDAAAAAVPDELVQGTTLVGPESYIRERLAAYREAGVTILNVSPVGPDPVGTIARLRRLVDA